MNNQKKRKKSKPDFIRIPPHSNEAEISVIGGILLMPKSIENVIDIIKPTDFYKEAHKKIFRAIFTLHSRNEPIDQVTVTEILKSNDLLEEVGGAYYISGLAEAVPSSANIRYWAEIIKEKSDKRKMIIETNEIQKEAYDDHKSAGELVSDFSTALDSFMKDRDGGYENSLTVMPRVMNMIEGIQEGAEKYIGIESGLIELDAILHGFKKTDLIILAGRPSMGKTALALSIIKHVSKHFKVGMFNLEMANEQLGMRLFTMETGISLDRILSGNLSKNDWHNIANSMSDVQYENILLEDNEYELFGIEAKAKKMVRDGAKLIVIDYLQLMNAVGRFDNRQQEVTTISRRLKLLAKKMNVPVIALSQLSRSCEQRTDKRPMLSDLRESGAIEQDADIVMFVYRDIVYRARVEDIETIPIEERKEAEIIIAKNRNGAIGTAKTVFRDKITLFDNPDIYNMVPDHVYQEETVGF